MNKKAQIGIEYMIIMGFVTFMLVGLLGVAFYYSNSIKDRIKVMQIGDCANRITSIAESVFYAGYPSKSSVSCYLPEGVNEILISDNDVIITFQLSSGISKTAYSSKVPLAGTVQTFSGVREISISAQEENSVLIGLV